MKRVANTPQILLIICAVLFLAAAATAGESAEIRLKNGSRWRGEMNSLVTVRFEQLGVMQDLSGRLVQLEDSYIIVEGLVAGKAGRKLIYKGDIVSMTSADDVAGADGVAATPAVDASGKSTAGSPGTSKSDLGVFILPLKGPVGETIRHDEIRMIAEHADQYGPGQIIVLVINTNGGLVLESEKIVETVREAKKRHRVIAWIQKAISAGAMTAMCCEEIYFTTEGTCGSVTTLMGNQSAPQEMQDENTEYFAQLAIENGHSPHIARAMKQNKYMCSYDKDPITGEVTYYNDLSGEFILSDGSSNLTFTSSNAAHCGFSNGTADRPEQLAALLDLPEWNEKDDYGRRIAANWERTVEQASEEVPRLIARLDYWKAGGGDLGQVIGGQIQILTELSRWCDRAEVMCAIKFGLDKRLIELSLEQLRKDLAEYRRTQRTRY